VDVNDVIDSLPDDGISPERLNRIVDGVSKYQSFRTVEPEIPSEATPYEDMPYEYEHDPEGEINIPDELSIQEMNSVLGLIPGDEGYIDPPVEDETDSVSMEFEDRDEGVGEGTVKRESPYQYDKPQGEGSVVGNWLSEKANDDYRADVDPEVMAVVKEDMALGNKVYPKGDFRNSIRKYEPGEITVDTAIKSTVAGLKETFSEDYHYKITKGLIGLTAAEQGLAKLGVVALEEFGMMNTADALLMLGQEELHPHNIIDYYWRTDSRGEKYAKAIVGLGADIFFDPLTYLTLGGSAMLKVGGKVVDISKMGARERGVNKILHEMDLVLTESGKIKIQKSQLPKLQEKISEHLLTKESVAKDLSNEYRHLTAGFRIPFTNIGTEVKIPFVGKAMGNTYINTLWAAGKLGGKLDDEIYKGIKLLKKDKQIDAAYGYEQFKESSVNVFKKMDTWATDSGIPLFDDARLSFLNKQNESNIYLRESEDKIVKEFHGADDAFINDVIAEIENTPLRSIDDTLKKFGKTKYTKGDLNVATHTTEVKKRRIPFSKVEHQPYLVSPVTIKKNSEYLSKHTKRMEEFADLMTNSKHYRSFMSDDMFNFYTKNYNGVLTDNSPKWAKIIRTKFPDDIDLKNTMHNSWSMSAAMKENADVAKKFSDTLKLMQKNKIYMPTEMIEEIKILEDFIQAGMDVSKNKRFGGKFDNYKKGSLTDASSLPKNEAESVKELITTVIETANGLSKEIKIHQKTLDNFIAEARTGKFVKTGRGYKAEKYGGYEYEALSTELGFSEDYLNIASVKMTDIQRRQRLSSHKLGPVAIKYIEKVRQENLTMVNEYYQRFPWFKELNPFGVDWAKGYLHHKTSKEWITHWRGEKNALSAQKSFIENNIGKSDSAAYGRMSRQTIEAANNESKLKYKHPDGSGVKIFETDPIAGHTTRMRDMSLTLRKHDFLEEVAPLIKTSHQTGYEPVFSPSMMRAAKEMKTKGMSKVESRQVVSESEKIWDDLNFLPKQYKDALFSGKNVYLPTDVKTRLDWLLNPRKYTDMAAMGVKSMHMYNNLFKSAALWGPGYLGQNLFSNIITYGYAGGSAKHLYKAMELLSPTSFSRGVTLGGKKYTKKEMYDLLVQEGMFNTSMVEEINWNAVTDNLGATYRYKKDPSNVGKVVAKGAKTVAEMATLYRANRWAARVGDEFPKAAFFMSKLDEGYSVRGATESANLWFFNFKDKSKAQHIASNIIPFSSFAIKTAEQTLTNIKRGKLGHLTLPPKVRSVLQGQYVSDQNTVDALQSIMPEYYANGQDPIHGPLLPGANEILLQAPWALGTLSFVLNPENSMHPVIKMIGMLGGYEDHQYSETLAEEDWWRQASSEINRLIPPPVLEAMTSLELNGVNIPYIDATARYKLRPPLSGGDKSSNNMERLRFTNEADFMEWFDTHHSNWLFNMFIHGQAKPPSRKKMNVSDLANYGSKGKWVRKYFRQLTLGMAKVEPMDRDFQFRYTAIRKQERILRNKLYEELDKNRGMGMVDVNSLDDPAQLTKMAAFRSGKSKELITERLDLIDKRDSLFVYYDTYLNSRMNNLNMFELIFGINEDNVYFDTLPKPFTPSQGEKPSGSIIPKELEE